MQNRDTYEVTMALGAYVFGALAIAALVAGGIATNDKGLIATAALSAGAAWAAQFAGNWAHAPLGLTIQRVSIMFSAFLFLLGLARLVV